MAWTVILEDENKSVVAFLEDDIHWSSDNLKRLKLLCYLDPYGDAIFNRLQMEDLIKDLRDLDSAGKGASTKEIELLAERCKSEPHTYLVFYGD